MGDLVDAGRWIYINGNGSLENVDGLQSVETTDELRLTGNAALGDCQGIVKLIDPIDDFEPGPGPGDSGHPDQSYVSIVNNDMGCNSVNQVLGGAPLSRINAGLNDAWFNPETNGQGFFLTVYPQIEQVFISWYTYELERPDDSVTAQLGDPGHRWLTAQGDFIDNQAILEVWVASAGVFDSSQPEARLAPDGQLILDFQACNEGTVTSDIPSVDRQGMIPIERVALDNVSLCYTLEKQALSHAASQTD